MSDLNEGLRSDLIECRLANTALQASVSELRAQLAEVRGCLRRYVERDKSVLALNAIDAIAESVLAGQPVPDTWVSELEAKLEKVQAELEATKLARGQPQTYTVELIEARAKLDQAKAFYLHTDDNYYWTPEAWKEFQGLRAKLERAREWIEKHHEMPGYSELLLDLNEHRPDTSAKPAGVNSEAAVITQIRWTGQTFCSKHQGFMCGCDEVSFSSAQTEKDKP